MLLSCTDKGSNLTISPCSPHSRYKPISKIAPIDLGDSQLVPATVQTFRLNDVGVVLRALSGGGDNSVRPSPPLCCCRLHEAPQIGRNRLIVLFHQLQPSCQDDDWSQRTGNYVCGNFPGLKGALEGTTAATFQLRGSIFSFLMQVGSL